MLLWSKIDRILIFYDNNVSRSLYPYMEYISFFDLFTFIRLIRKTEENIIFSTVYIIILFFYNFTLTECNFSQFSEGFLHRRFWTWVVYHAPVPHEICIVWKVWNMVGVKIPVDGARRIPVFGNNYPYEDHELNILDESVKVSSCTLYLMHWGVSIIQWWNVLNKNIVRDLTFLLYFFNRNCVDYNDKFNMIMLVELKIK